MKIIITCEHAGNHVPINYLEPFQANIEVLLTHEAVDFGALELAKSFAKRCGNYFCAAKTTRLLVDLNRSLHHPQLFSLFTKNISAIKKEALLIKYYYPYRKNVEDYVKKMILTNEKVVHLSVHSFTPYFKNVARPTDIGFLYNPKRQAEKQFCASWKKNFTLIMPSLTVNCNAPYRGTADGFVTYLRKKFPENYIGIELEVNQKLIFDESLLSIVRDALVRSFDLTLRSLV